jgi:hypothetical protein
VSELIDGTLLVLTDCVLKDYDGATRVRIPPTRIVNLRSSEVEHVSILPAEPPKTT